MISSLHPGFAGNAARPLAQGHFDEAVRIAAFALNTLLRERSGLADIEGQDLAGKALGGSSPKLLLAPADSLDRKAEQDGWRMLAQGCVAALRNPVAHRPVYRDQDSTFEALATISMVMRRIDAATS